MWPPWQLIIFLFFFRVWSLTCHCFVFFLWKSMCIVPRLFFLHCFNILVIFFSSGFFICKFVLTNKYIIVLSHSFLVLILNFPVCIQHANKNKCLHDKELCLPYILQLTLLDMSYKNKLWPCPCNHNLSGLMIFSQGKCLKLFLGIRIRQTLIIVIEIKKIKAPKKYFS